MNYNRRLVNHRRFLGLLCLFTLALAARTFANGNYQWSEDRKKALIWNNDPKPGDGATWTGAHDNEGYATGSGILTWYRVDRGFTTGSNIAVSHKKTPISSYSGTMVHGKFNGTVTTVDHGKTYNANFADGQRKGQWSSEPAVAKAETTETVPAAKNTEPVAPEKPASVATGAAPTKTASPAEETLPIVTAEAPTTTDIPAAGPEQATNLSNHASEVSTQKPESTESTALQTSNSAAPLIAQASTTQPDESTTPRQPVTRKTALAPGAVRAIDRPGTPAKKPEPARTKSEKSEKPKAKPSPSETTEVQPEVTNESPAEGPATEAQTEKLEAPALKSERSAPTSSPPAAKETPVDDSIRTLVGPPSSLRTGPPKPEASPKTEAAPPPPVEAPAPESSAPDGPKLTAVEAMDIADIEARTRGYDLGEYQLPKAEYNATNDTWSVSYGGRESDKSKKLSVTVQDKSGKAEVKK